MGCVACKETGQRGRAAPCFWCTELVPDGRARMSGAHRRASGMAAARNHGGSWPRAVLLCSCRHGAWHVMVGRYIRRFCIRLVADGSGTSG
jgi:hypothetical protein